MPINFNCVIFFTFLIFPLYEFLSQIYTSNSMKNNNNLLYLSYISFLFLCFLNFYFIIGILISSILLLVNDYKNKYFETANKVIPLMFLMFFSASLVSFLIDKNFTKNNFIGYLPIFLYFIIIILFFVYSICYLYKMMILIINIVGSK